MKSHVDLSIVQGSLLMKFNIYSRFLYPMLKSHDFIHLFGEKKKKNPKDQRRLKNPNTPKKVS